MSADLAVLVPVLDRPLRVTPTLTSFYRTAPGCRVLFIADPNDFDELAAIRAGGAEYIVPGGNYASKIRAGVEATETPLLFLGADDLDPQLGWLEAAKAEMKGGAEVVGVNDLIPRRRRRHQHATHFLLTRAYAERPTIDGQPGPLFTGYGHEKTDDELIATARHRGAYAYAPGAHVKHLHPDVGTAEWDETYAKGRATRDADRDLFWERARLWA